MKLFYPKFIVLLFFLFSCNSSNLHEIISESLNVKYRDADIQKIDSKYFQYEDSIMIYNIGLLQNIADSLSISDSITLFNIVQFETELNNRYIEIMDSFMYYLNIDSNKNSYFNKKANNVKEHIDNANDIHKSIQKHYNNSGVKFDYLPESAFIIDTLNLYLVKNRVNNKNYIYDFDENFKSFIFFEILD